MLTLKQKLGANIEYLRKKKGLSQEKLAELINMDVPNLSNIERGKRFITAATLEKIAVKLEVTEKDLFDFSRDEPERYLYSDIKSFMEDMNEHDLCFIIEILKNYKLLKEKYFT